MQARARGEERKTAEEADIEAAGGRPEPVRMEALFPQAPGNAEHENALREIQERIEEAAADNGNEADGEEPSESAEDDSGSESDSGSEGDECGNDLERFIRPNGLKLGETSPIRAKTAPLLLEYRLKEFKISTNFLNLEQAAVCAVQIHHRSDEKFDLDTLEGQSTCKRFLQFVEQLAESLRIKTRKRTYRRKFSNAYKVLYKDGKLCYLTEILDSAQEAFAYLYVNGEKYLFSNSVIDTGKKLYDAFCQLLFDVKEIYSRILPEQDFEQILKLLSELREILEDFDTKWVKYEKQYVRELMIIE